LRAPTHKVKAAIGVIGLLATLALGSTAAIASAPGGAAPPGSEPKLVPDRHYVDPFSIGSWSLSRTDMGVDYIPIHPDPVLAVGDAQILGSSSHASWPGGHFIWYRLLDGNHAGAVIYVAEHLRGLAPAGVRVRPGQQIATALPGYPWTEWGWATPAGEPRALPCYREGMETNSGREMARFLGSLGARTSRRLELGPDWPSGRLC
jgi:hypothetical protein